MAPKRKRELDIPGESTYPPKLPSASGTSGTTSGMDESAWTACRAILEGVYRRKQGSREVAAIFCQLPDRGMYDDYYIAITEPECLDNVAVGCVRR